MLRGREMTEPVAEPVYTIRYRDAHGFLQELTVSRATALAIRRIRKKYKRDREKWDARHVDFTDLSRDVNADQKVPEGSNQLLGPKRRSQQGNPWEGPRFSFDRLIGESRTWRGDPVINGWCTFCNRAPLSTGECCLGCTRTGKDHLIPTPTPADHKRLNRYRPKDDGLKGGKG